MYVIEEPPPVVLVRKGDPNCDHDVSMADFPAERDRIFSNHSAPYRQWVCLKCARTVRQSLVVEPKLRMPEPT
jgi:hypothetical protein